MTRETRIVVQNYQLDQVTSTQEHHLQQNESKIEDIDHNDLANYQLQHPIYNRLHTYCSHFQFEHVDNAEVFNYMLWKSNHNETPDEVYIHEVIGVYRTTTQPFKGFEMEQDVDLSSDCILGNEYFTLQKIGN